MPVDLKIRVQGEKEIQKYITTLAKKTPGTVKKIISKVLIIVEGEAKKLVPTDTGRLRGSITHEVRQREQRYIGIVGSKVKYAGFVEKGTKRHLAFVGKWAGRHGFPTRTRFLWVSGKAQPYLNPAFENKYNAVTNHFSNEIKRLIKS